MYNIDDCVLIRKTTVFPKDGIIETPEHGIAYNFGRSTVLGDALYDILSEKYPDYEQLKEEIEKFDIYFESNRSTIHFTINGVVSNSLYGQFDYPYAIIEPLKHHINEESLLGLRVEDTYFSDDIKLSNEAIILIPEDIAYALEEKYSFTGMNIRTYTGNIEDAIKEILQELNYDFFVVNDHGYRDGLDSNTKDAEMFDFISNYSKNAGISQTRHFYSDIKMEDERKRLEEAEKVDVMHLNYLLESGLVSDELISKINELLEYRDLYKNDFKELMKELIKEIGLDNLEVLTKEFNKMMIEERNRRKENKNDYELT